MFRIKNHHWIQTHTHASNEYPTDHSDHYYMIIMYANNDNNNKTRNVMDNLITERERRRSMEIANKKRLKLFNEKKRINSVIDR